MDRKRHDFPPGAGPHALVTRPEPDASAFAALLEKAGMRAVKTPAMAIEATGAAISLDGVAALAFTSANGVRALARRGPPPPLPVFAVGAATAAAAREAGFACVTAAGGDVGSLAALIAGARPLGAVLHASGEAAAGDLVGALEAAGVEARRVALYRAVAMARLSPEAEAALASGDPPQWATFFSPRSARLFLDQAKVSGLTARLEAVRAACLSAAVADAARGARWAGVVVAHKTTAEALIEAMQRADSREPGS